MDQLIPVLNKLQDLLAPVGMHVAFDLPQLVVVGSQSVGKSSVLESLVGRDFLPRGTGIVTRRPLILQLRNTPAVDGKVPREWGEFQHLPGKKFEDFDQIRLEIMAETERMCGKNSGISSNPISLRIYSPSVIDLTLVDLPGITKIPVGDQPSDIELRIRELVIQYISKPNCLILAVTAANTDIANSDSLKLAREFDPEGSRTIGVITKLDSMDEGTDCLDILQGKVYPLKLGFAGVVCRNQKDIIAKKTVKESVVSEEKFFSNHLVYKVVANQCGTGFLGRLLHKVLMHHIHNTLPTLKSRIMEIHSDYLHELAGLGEPLLDPNNGSAAAIVLNLFTRFSRNFQDAIDGRFHSDQLVGGARIHYIFYDVFAKAIYQFDSFSGLTDQEIRTAIRNATGPRTALFVPEIAFETLVRRQIAKLEDPALQCAEQVNEELHRLVSQCELPEMARFSALREKMYLVVKHVLKRCLQPTKEMISNLIQCELAYINTNHPDFIGGSRAISSIAGSNTGGSSSMTRSNSVVGPAAAGTQSSASPTTSGVNRPPIVPSQPNSEIVSQKGPPPETNGFFSSFLRGAGTTQQPTTKRQDLDYSMYRTCVSLNNSLDNRPNNGLRLAQVPDQVCAPEEPSDRERIESDIIKSLILSYFNIVKRNVCDLVPKTIMHFTVNSAKDILQKELVSQLYREDMFKTLLREPDGIAEKRAHCKEMLTILKNAIDVLATIRDIDTNGTSFLVSASGYVKNSSAGTLIATEYHITPQSPPSTYKPNSYASNNTPLTSHNRKIWEGM